MSGAQADGAFFSANVDTYDLQRIEVLRGPQGTLYGAAAEGGIIKYVTNLPNLNKVEGGCLDGRPDRRRRSNAGNIKGLINLPFWDNKAALRVSAVESNIPGWIDNPAAWPEQYQQRQQLQLARLLAGPADLAISPRASRYSSSTCGFTATIRSAGGGCRGEPAGAARQPVSNASAVSSTTTACRTKRTILSSMAR